MTEAYLDCMSLSVEVSFMSVVGERRIGESLFWIPESTSVQIFTSCISGRGNGIGPVCLCVCASVCNLVVSRLNHLSYRHKLVCVCRSIMAKGLWGEETLQHESREVRQRSGVFHVKSL